MLKIRTKSENETIKFAKKFSKSVAKGSIILLVGDLGAGKTHFVKGFAKGKGCKGVVTSPTFTIMNIYEGKTNIYHFDMYRLNDPSELENLGFEEYFDKSMNGITLVEWPDKAGELTKRYDYKVEIKNLGENDREITITKEGEQC